MKFIDLLRPMLLLSVGLHVLLLLLPLGRADETVPAADEGASVEPELFVDAETEDLEESPETNLEPTPPSAPPTPPVQAVAAQARSRSFPPTVVATPSRQPVARPAPSTEQPETSQPTVAAAPAVGSVPDLSAPAASDPAPPPAPLLEARAAASNTAAAEPAGSDAARSESPAAAAPADLGQQAYAMPPVPDALKALLAYFNQALSYDAAGTSDQAAQAAQADWTEASRTALKVEQLQVQTLDPPVRLSYPIENPQEIRRSLQACLPEMPHTAEVGILLDESGAATPTLLRSTGYSSLNKEALALVKARMNHLENPEAQAYVVKVEIRYNPESCTSLAELAPPESDRSKFHDRLR